MPEQEHKFRKDADGNIYAICPHCGQKIYYLDYAQTGTYTYEATPTDYDEFDYETDEFYPDDNGEIYTCPECGAEIPSKDALALFYDDDAKPEPEPEPSTQATGPQNEAAA